MWHAEAPKETSSCKLAESFWSTDTFVKLSVHRNDSLKTEVLDNLLPDPTTGLAEKFVTQKIIVNENVTDP